MTLFPVPSRAAMREMVVGEVVGQREVVRVWDEKERRREGSRGEEKERRGGRRKEEEKGRTERERRKEWDASSDWGMREKGREGRKGNKGGSATAGHGKRAAHVKQVQGWCRSGYLQ
ncbi:hypothetical protein E2C01_064949 [Portunus trituberculatus]|uniref:Uncharacterized protein n=1 Tax=Portunus trituberculatus TaxID=210409 RepID=A0A5B7HM70_PORTR|nr:hypothetical protein [Portunus trituberculatus]